MKLMKKYFLFVADVPVGGAFFTVFIPGVIALVFLLFYSISTDQAVSYFEESFWRGAITCVVLFILLAIANTIVAKTKITTVKSKSDEINLFHLPGDKVEILNRSKWGKYPVTSIKLPSDWWSGITKGTGIRMDKEIKIRINSEVMLFIPVHIKFTFSGPFEAQDVRKTMSISTPLIPGRQSLDMGAFIEKIFCDFNLRGSGYTSMCEEAKSLNNESISTRAFTLCVLQKIDFPAKLFSNIDITEINIDSPIFNYSTVLMKVV